MPTITQKTVYTFDELDESAKEKAREWYRTGALDYEWWDFILDDAKQAGRLLGITITDIYFSGFSSQGDGACFEGSYSYGKGSLQAIRENYPQDDKLQRIARMLFNEQQCRFYRLTAATKQAGRYYDMDIDVYDGEYYADNGPAEAVKDSLRDFARWIYGNLEGEYEYLMSDESVDDAITANEYTFDENGNRY